MLLIAATALAGTFTGLGWPCSRMNWAWRNVWSTCSINAYIPTDTGGLLDHAPAHWRRVPVSVANAPTTWVGADGAVLDNAAGPAPASQVPTMFCAAMMATGGNTVAGFTQLRNRCRRAVDAYAGIVRECQKPTLTAGNRGPITNSFYSDFAPGNTHVPHMQNSDRLHEYSRRCFAGAGGFTGPLVNPQNTCPGLLGWWTVVWNVCGFMRNAPTIANAGVEPQTTPNVAPLGGALSSHVFGSAASGVITAAVAVGPAGLTDGPNFVFCTPSQDAAGAFEPSTKVPTRWNQRGPNFRTSRCRKALDQFGRTAARCGGTTFPSNGPNTLPLRGSSDALRTLMVGAAAGSVPMSLGTLAPLCN